MPVLYLVTCGAPPAAEIPDQIPAFQNDGWDVCVIATPAALDFLDERAVGTATGRPVRSAPRKPGQVDPFPPADAVAVAPATFNTVNKWAAGISDTLALGILNELLSTGLPIAAAVWAKEVLRAHPAYSRSTAALSEAGVTFIGEGSGATDFLWESLRAALSEAR